MSKGSPCWNHAKTLKLEVRENPPPGFQGGNPKPPVFWVAPGILGGGVSTSLRIASQIDSIQIYTNCLQGPIIFLLSEKKNTCRSFFWLQGVAVAIGCPSGLFVGFRFSDPQFFLFSSAKKNSKPHVDGLLTEEQVFNTGTVCMCFLRRVSWICKFWVALPRTNMTPENRISPKGKGSPNHPFSGAMLVSGRV